MAENKKNERGHQDAQEHEPENCVETRRQRRRAIRVKHTDTFILARLVRAVQPRSPITTAVLTVMCQQVKIATVSAPSCQRFLAHVLLIQRSSVEALPLTQALGAL